MIPKPDLITSKLSKSLDFNYLISKIFTVLAILNFLIRLVFSNGAFKSGVNAICWGFILTIQRYATNMEKPNNSHQHYQLLTNISNEYMAKCPEQILMKLYRYNVFGQVEISFENFSAIILTLIFIMIDNFTSSIGSTSVCILVFALDILMKTIVLPPYIQSMIIIKSIMLTSVVIVHTLVFSAQSNYMAYIFYLSIKISILGFFLLFFYIKKTITTGKFYREYNIQNSFFITDNQFNLITYSDSDDFFLRDFEELYINDKSNMRGKLDEAEFENTEKEHPLLFMMLIIQSYLKRLMLDNFKYIDAIKIKNSNKLSCLILFLLDSHAFLHDSKDILTEEKESLKILIKEYKSIKSEIQDILNSMGASKEIPIPFYLFLSVNELLKLLNKDKMLSNPLSCFEISKKFSLYLSKVNSIVKRFHHFLLSTLSAKKSLTLGCFYYKNRVYWIKIAAVDFEKYFEYFDLNSSFSPLTQQLYITRVYSEVYEESIIFNENIQQIECLHKLSEDRQIDFSICPNETNYSAPSAELVLQLSKIIHDFKNPLQLIQSVASSLSSSIQLSNNSGANVQLQSQIEDLEMLRMQSDYILMLTENLNDFSRRMSNKQAQSSGIIMKLCDIKPVLSSCYEFFKYKQKNDCSKKNLSVNIKLSDNLPSQIITDSIKLKQIIINLMSNSYKFTTIGSIELKAELALSGLAVKIEINDTGLGMSKEELERLTEPYQMLERHKLLNNHGSGLGMSIIKDLLTKLNSELNFSSELEKGTKFWFELPIAIARDSTDSKKHATLLNNSKITNEINKSSQSILFTDTYRKQNPNHDRNFNNIIVIDDDSAIQPIGSFYSQFELQKMNKSFSMNSANSEDGNNILESSMTSRKLDGNDELRKSLPKEGSNTSKCDDELPPSPIREVRPKSKLSKKYLLKGHSNENFFTIQEQDRENEIELPDSTTLDESICFEELMGKILFNKFRYC